MEIHEVEKSTDAILKSVWACVCGFDLWWYCVIADRDVLLDAVLKGETHPGNKCFNLDEIQKAYRAMDKREAIKSLVIISK